MAVGQLSSPYRPEPAGQPVRLAPRPPLLAGREELLTELHERLSSGEDGGPRIVVLCGLGGAGKTSVALEYAYRHLAEVGLAWEFAAEEAPVLAAGFGELAAQLGARDLVDTRDPVASVHAVLAAYPREWLLLFDNAPNREAMAAYLPPARRGRVLITSQNPNWPPGQALGVAELDVQVAASFLVNRTGDPDQQAAIELAGELGGLPLALEQAAAYIQATGGTLAEYLRLFREHRDAMLARGEPTGYTKTVATTWSLAFRQLEQSAPPAVALLRLLACCAPEAIPLSSLLQAYPRIPRRARRRVNALLAPLLKRPVGRQRCDRGAVPVLSRDPRWDWIGLRAPASAGRHHWSDARRRGRSVAASRRRLDRGRYPNRYPCAGRVADMRRVASTRRDDPY